MAGYWLNPERNQIVKVATTHDEWLREHALDLGLPEAAYQEIMSYAATDIDPIRMVGLRYGLVRVREHKWHVSVQFAADSGRSPQVIQVVATALTGLGIHPDTFLVIDNLLLNESRSLTLREL